VILIIRNIKRNIGDNKVRAIKATIISNILFIYKNK
jgi:hypothetical protein